VFWINVSKVVPAEHVLQLHQIEYGSRGTTDQKYQHNYEQNPGIKWKKYNKDITWPLSWFANE
jgi:hypothetical protein